MLLAAVFLSAVALSVLGTPIDNRREPNAVTGVEETREAPDPDRGSNWLDEGRVAPDPDIWAVERRAAQGADSASIWTVEKRAAQDRDSASIWTVEKRAPAIAKS